jgi:hypothetical protein
MANGVFALSKSNEQNLKQIRKLFKPPVLTSEDLGQYNTFLAKLIETFGPLDFLELILINDVMAAQWEMMRYSDHKIMAIERERDRQKEEKVEELRGELDKHKHALARLKEQAEGDAGKAKTTSADGTTKHAEDTKTAPAESVTNQPGEPQAAAANNAKAATSTTSSATDEASETNSVATDGAHDQPEGAPAATEGTADQPDKSDTPPSLFDRKLELEAIIGDTVGEIDEILSANAEETEHAEALEADVDFYERLDRMYGRALKRRNEALDQLEFHRKGLGRELRRMSDDVIDAEFAETSPDVPALAGVGDDEQ